MGIITKYLEILENIQGDSDYIYRGQSDAKWHITSSYFRRFNCDKKEKEPSKQPSADEFKEYHNQLIKDTKSDHYHQDKNLSDIELLAVLRHFGRPTALSDFSRNFLIALWFACNENQDKNAKVFLFDLEHCVDYQDNKNLYENTLNHFCLVDPDLKDPDLKGNNRIFAQHSVFIFSNKSFKGYEKKFIEIDANDKSKIIQDLKNTYDITENRLFRDIPGFATLNNDKHPIQTITSREHSRKAKHYEGIYDFDNAIKHYKLALASDIKAYGEAHPQVAVLYNNIGRVWQANGKYDKALEYYALALASDIKTYGKNHPNVAIRHNYIGGVWQAKGKYDKALEYFELALASDSKTDGEVNPNVASLYNNIGLVWYAKGKYDKALKYFKLALASDIKTHGEAHPDVAINQNNIGSAWYAKGEYDKALKCFELALASDIKTYGKAHPNVASRYNNIGNVWMVKEKYDKALEYYELALVSDIKTYGEEHPNVASRHNNIGNVWKAKGKYDKALEYYDLALVSDIKTYGENHPAVAIRYNNIGGAWGEKGKYDESLKYFKLALATFEKTLGKEHPNTKEVAENLKIIKAAKQDKK